MNNVHAFKPREKQESPALKAYRVKYSFLLDGIEYTESKKYMCLTSCDAAIKAIDEIAAKEGKISEVRVSAKPI